GRPAEAPPAPRAAAWRALEEHQRQLAGVTMTDLFAGDTGRFERFSYSVAELLVDMSKHRMTSETLTLLLQLANTARVAQTRDAMFGGQPVNSTEERAVMHVALRNRSDRPMTVDGADVMPQVREVLDQMRRFSESVRSGEWRGHAGDRITDVV